MVFGYFITSACPQKAKQTLNFLPFPLVKFLKIWQIGSKYFIFIRARFSGKSGRPVFFAAVKDINMKKIEKTTFTNPIFFVFKICNPLDAICCENF